jgi:ATP-dependent RNA helicase RhlE
VDAIHGNKSQNARQHALDGFRIGRSRILVATDIAARGIDVDDVSHVINLDIPDVAENYVHRIGRTARAGNGGVAIAFCDPSERDSLRAIERLLKRSLAVAGGERHPADVKWATEDRQDRSNSAPRPRKRSRNRRNVRKAA